MPWLRSFLVICVCCAGALAGEWPQWLGPTRDAVSPEIVNPWKDAPSVLWRQPVGEGHSSPIVAGGRVFLHHKVANQDQEEILAFDARTGRSLWRTPYPRSAFSSQFGNGPRATPAISDGRLYTLGVTGVLSCFEAATGKQIWQIDTLKQFKAPNLFFGVSCSPLIDGNHVFVNVGGKGASIVAFAKDSGEVHWKSLDDPASYAAPILFGQEPARQLVFLTQQGLVSLNPANGEAHWKFPLKDLLSESSTTPVRAGNMLLASSVTYGSVGLNLETKDGKPTTNQAWKNSSLTCYFSTPVVVGTAHAFMVTGAIVPPQATLRCVEIKTGKELWSKPKIGKYHASLLRTGNDRLLLLDDAGNLILLDPNPQEYRELARSKVCRDTWAHPALSDGRLYLRDDKEVICLKLRD